MFDKIKCLCVNVLDKIEKYFFKYSRLEKGVVLINKIFLPYVVFIIVTAYLSTHGMKFSELKNTGGLLFLTIFITNVIAFNSFIGHEKLDMIKFGFYSFVAMFLFSTSSQLLGAKVIISYLSVFLILILTPLNLIIYFIKIILFLKSFYSSKLDK